MEPLTEAMRWVIQFLVWLVNTCEPLLGPDICADVARDWWRHTITWLFENTTRVL